MKSILNIFILISVINYKVACETTNGSTLLLSPVYEPCGESKIGKVNVLTPNGLHQGSYPWAAAVLHDNTFLCDGTLVTNRKIVSAAHCFLGKDSTEKQADEIVVVLGAKNLENLYEVGRVMFGVDTINIHQNWNPFTAKNDADVAVLTLSEEVTFSNFIQPACIARIPKSMTDINDGEIIQFKKSEISSSHNYELARINTQIQKPEDCFNKFPQLLGISSFRTICVGNSNGTSECTGNKGAGLTVVNNGRHFLRGIASTSFYTAENQCDTEAFTIFTDMRFYFSFVKNAK